jgi:glycosyltransferase involved in cell wall biosynthesis
MCASDVCILPSKVAKISAGLPLKLLEYLACKKPVIITPIQEVLNCLRNVVAIYHDHQELYDILKRMCEGKIQKTSSIEEGYRFALSRSWDNISRDYERLLINTFSGR